MLRTALQPRWIALLALALGLATLFAYLGSWQLDRSRRGDSPAQPSVLELTDVAAPQQTLEGDALMHQVRTRGEYRADQQLEVVGRTLDGEPGAWVLTPLTVSAEGQDASLAVVRGWVPEGVEPPAPPAGEVEVVGWLQGSELPADPDPDLAPDQVRSVSAAELVNRWQPPVYAGYLVATDDTAGQTGGTLQPVPVEEPGQGGFHLLNFSYALQWWVFAAFAVFLWWRFVRDAYRDEQAAAEVAEHEEHAERTGGRPEPVAGDNGGTRVEEGKRP